MITAIVLAAGEGSRMGELKQLLPWGEKTIIETVISRLQASNLEGEVRVVLGAEADRVREVLENNTGLDPVIKENPDYSRGMFSSVLTGMEDIPSEVEGLLFMLADQPLVTTSIYNRLLAEFRRREPLLMAPSCRGNRGHPLLISSSLIPEIYELAEGGEPEGGLRSLLRKRSDDIEYVDIDDKAVITDLDYKEDYREHHPGRFEGE